MGNVPDVTVVWGLTGPISLYHRVWGGFMPLCVIQTAPWTLTTLNLTKWKEMELFILK